MTNALESSTPSDIPLLLHADAEQWWLHREVIPVLRHLEMGEELPEELLGAALAYLEAMWNEASVRAGNTDAAHSRLCSHTSELDTLSGTAKRYHTAVRALRGIVAERVTPFVEPPHELTRHQSNESNELRVNDTRLNTSRPDSGGRTPRAA